MKQIIFYCLSIILFTSVGCKKKEEPNEVKLIGEWESVSTYSNKKIMSISEQSITITPYEADGKTPIESISGEVISKTTNQFKYRIYYSESNYSAEFEYDYYFGENGDLFLGDALGTYERYIRKGE